MNDAGIVDRYADAFHRTQALLPGTYVPWLQAAREEALMAFLDKGFPSTRDEDWKYTSVAAIEKSNFVLKPASADICFDLGCIGTQALPGARLLVFIDGRHAPELSRIGPLPAGAMVTGMAAMLQREPEKLRAALDYPAGGYASSFGALNAAFAGDGAYVDLAPGVCLEEPLHLLFITTTTGIAMHLRNVVVAGAGSRVDIVEQHLSLDAAAYFNNVVTDITVERGAAVRHYKFQDEGLRAFHIAAVAADVGADARFESTSLAFGGLLARTDVDVKLAAEKAVCNLDGLYVADGRQHIDHHTRIDHAQPRCTSREFYKGVLDGASRAVFNGKVIVRAGAQQSDAHQANRNLLLSDQAEVDTKPQLEIWADDVKCGHGATVGQLDPDQIFYLRARGIDAEAARSLLVFAFANEIVERIGVASLRSAVERLLRARLPQGTAIAAGAMQ